MDREPEELRMEVRDTDRRQGSRPSPRKRNANRQSGCLRALQIAEKRRKAKDERKGNAEFQRISRRDWKAFHSDQCKQIEENNRMGKTRDRFKESRDTKGSFYVKMSTI